MLQVCAGNQEFAKCISLTVNLLEVCAILYVKI